MNKKEETQTFNIAKYRLEERLYTLKELKALVQDIERHEKETKKRLDRVMRVLR